MSVGRCVSVKSKGRSCSIDRGFSALSTSGLCLLLTVGAGRDRLACKAMLPFCLVHASLEFRLKCFLLKKEKLLLHIS